MIRPRALGVVVTVLLGTAVLPSASLPAADQAVSAAAAAAHSEFNQQTFWQTTKVYCDTCHFGPKAKAKLNLQSLEPRQARCEWRDVGKGSAQAAQPRDAAGRHAAARCGHLRMRSSNRSRPDAIAWRRPSPIPDAPRSIGSTERNTRMPFAICWRWRLTSPNCCRPTTSATASTISETCCRYRRVLLERYLSVARKISRAAVGDTDDARGLSDLYRSSWARSGRSSERSRAGRLARRHRRSPPVPGGRRI